MPVTCTDGAFGELDDVVIDPGTRRLTHIIVKPADRHERARLVPIETARSRDGSAGVTLGCTGAEVCERAPVQEAAYVRTGESIEGGSDWDAGIQDMFAVTDYGTLGPEILGAGMAMDYDQHVGVSYHRIPKGCVEIRRTSAVTGRGGHHLGHVIGFVLEDDATITSLVIEHGHLWGRRAVAIPGSAIDRFDTDELMVTLSVDDVEALKSLPAHHWWS
ncbi:MAG: hypothetical protein WBQ18_14045 [Solirubrobacteraceae bacterium]